MSDQSDAESVPGGMQIDDEDDLVHGPSDVEDEIGAETGPEHTDPVNEEEEDDYEEPADEQGGAVSPTVEPGSKGAKNKAGPREGDAKAKGEVHSLTKLAETGYMLYAKKVYEAPLARLGTSAGRVRDFGKPIFVSDGDKLAEMHKGGAWPPPEAVHPLSIVVVKGLTAEGQLSSSKDKGPYVWYARIGIEGKPDGDDVKILRHVPREFCKKYVAWLSQQDPPQCHSSLITKYQPEDLNAKKIDVKFNGSFRERKDVKLVTEATKANRKAATGGDDDAGAEDAACSKGVGAGTSGGASASKKGGASTPAARSKGAKEKAHAQEQVAAAAADMKQDKLNFSGVAKPKSAATTTASRGAGEADEARAASLPPSSFLAVHAEADGRSGSPPRSPTAPAPAPAPASTSTSNNGKRPKDKDEFPKVLPLTYSKRARIVVGLRKESTHILWEGDNLYIIPYEIPVPPPAE